MKNIDENNNYDNLSKEDIAELELYRKQINTQKIVEIIFFIITISLFILGIMYLCRYFYPIN